MPSHASLGTPVELDAAPPDIAGQVAGQARALLGERFPDLGARNHVLERLLELGAVDEPVHHLLGPRACERLLDRRVQRARVGQLGRHPFEDVMLCDRACELLRQVARERPLGEAGELGDEVLVRRVLDRPPRGASRRARREERQPARGPERRSRPPPSVLHVRPLNTPPAAPTR